MRWHQPAAPRGSQKWLQVLINERPELLNTQVAPRIGIQPNEISWLSPLKQDDYSEYSDNDFISRLGVTLDKLPLRSFWPERGPVWDGLGKTDRGDLILVEAKAHIPEIVSSPSGAGERSLTKILSSLETTKQFLGSQSKADRSTCFYQYTNRLAHLYLLREMNNLPAFLLFLYFMNDKVMKGPKTEAEWEAAILLLELFLGVRNHRLSRYVIHAFVDIRALKALDN